MVRTGQISFPYRACVCVGGHLYTCLCVCVCVCVYGHTCLCSCFFLSFFSSFLFYRAEVEARGSGWMGAVTAARTHTHTHTDTHTHTHMAICAGISEPDVQVHAAPPSRRGSAYLSSLPCEET